MDKKNFNALMLTMIGTTIIGAAANILTMRTVVAVQSEKIDVNKTNIERVELRVNNLEDECVTREILHLSIKNNKTN